MGWGGGGGEGQKNKLRVCVSTVEGERKFGSSREDERD